MKLQHSCSCASSELETQTRIHFIINIIVHINLHALHLGFLGLYQIFLLKIVSMSHPRIYEKLLLETKSGMMSQVYRSMEKTQDIAVLVSVTPLVEQRDDVLQTYACNTQKTFERTSTKSLQGPLCNRTEGLGEKEIFLFPLIRHVSYFPKLSIYQRIKDKDNG